MVTPLQAQRSQPPPGVLRVRFVGHLSVSSFMRAVEHASSVFGAGGIPRVVLFDCLAMAGYDRGTREAFAAWHRDRRDHIERAAVVTTNGLWHLVISTMSLAARMPIRPFSTVAEAEGWLLVSPTILPERSRLVVP